MPSVEGYVDYQRREFCKDVGCPIQLLLDEVAPDSEQSLSGRVISD